MICKKALILQLNKKHCSLMKLLSEDIRKRILDEAMAEFRQKGYLKTSMRDIAQKVGISTGNIYNYFASKDEMFKAVVQPVIYRFYLMLEEHHGMEHSDITDMLSEEYLHNVVDEYITLIRKQRTLLGILLFKAQGSSLEHFKEEYTDKATAQVKLWLNKEKAKNKDMNATISEFFLHLHSVWLFTMLEEVIMHNIHGDDLERVVNEYIKFEIYGWKEMFNL